MKRYTVEINGVTTTLRLSDKDAERRGLTADEPPAAPTKARTPANKSRQPANKRADIAAMAFVAKEGKQ